MRRDMDLIRTILRTVADACDPVPLSTFVDDAHPHGVVVYHYQLLSESGLANVSLRYAGNACQGGEVTSLTWAGCDLLDSISSDSIWASVKAELAKVGGSVTVDIVKAVAKSKILSRLGIT